MADGALRADVLKVLAQHGVDVAPMPGSSYRLSKGEALIVVRLLDIVSRTTVSKLQRRFGIPITKFFPPLSAAHLKVLPKASGNPTPSKKR